VAGVPRIRLQRGERNHKKWIRLAVWDSAGNGAFTEPVQLQ